jgi:hypothetical protein
MIRNNLADGIGTSYANNPGGDQVNNDSQIFHSLIKGELKC